MAKKKQLVENLVHGLFLLLGLITVGCVLLITIYLVVSGIPAIRKIGLVEFLFGRSWASTAAEPAYGILPFILTSIYGTAGAILVGVPVGFLCAVYLAKMAGPGIKNVVGAAVSLLAGIPSVVYGLVGMLALAQAVILCDDAVDGYFSQVKNSLIEMIARTPEKGGFALELLMISKYFERIGDHATNIAEWVIFSVTGVHKSAELSGE